jgi:hypothetical protein
MLDELHVILITIIFSLILYIITRFNTLPKNSSDKTYSNLFNQENRHDIENNIESDTSNVSENEIRYDNKPIVVYKMEYRSRNSSL